MYNHDNQQLIVALDIGTTKVVAVAGVLTELELIDVLGYGKVQSDGVKRGVVSNIDMTAKAISNAIDMAEKRAKREFQSVYVGIAGQHIKSLHHRGMDRRDDPEKEISQAEIDKIVNDMYKLGLPPGDKIIHVVPQEYTIDGEEGILEPVGMFGSTIEGNFHVITGKVSAANNILRCIEKAGLEAKEMVLEPIGSASAVLSKEELKAGVVMVDIGGGTSDVTIFQDGIIRHTAVIPMGGNIITADIKEGCSVMTEQAEKLKIKFGRALSDEIVDNRIITIPGLKGRPPREISELNLARIIQARMEEILDFVIWEIRRSGYEHKLLAGMVLTGGGALLKDIVALAEYHTGLSTRIGRPTEYLAHQRDTELQSPIYATSIGILRYGLTQVHKDDWQKELVLEKAHATSELEETVENGEEHRNGAFGKIMNRGFRIIKDFFEASPDSEL